MSTQILKTAKLSVTGSAGKIAAVALNILFITMVSAIGLYCLAPPKPLPVSAPAEEFSSERAGKHLQPIALKARPVGSAEHAEVIKYLVGQLSALGLNTELYKTGVASNYWGTTIITAGVMEDIIVKIGGTRPGQAILIMAHYDSVPFGPGAADDAGAVAAILETIRALKSGPPLKNDLIFLFTDGEEIGLLGAKAFVDKHPLAKEVRLVMNFEASGSAGPSIMFETSENNGRLIEEFARATRYPYANSLSYEIYRMMGRDTDLSMFKQLDVSALNFAHIHRPYHNHKATDNISNYDAGSLQHTGSYMLSLARHFGNLDSLPQRSQNAVYFDLLGFKLVNYRLSAALPLAVFICLLFAAISIYGFKKHRLTVWGMCKGILAFLLVITIVPSLILAIWWGVRLLVREVRLFPAGYIYGGNIFMYGMIALAIALSSALYLWFCRHTSTRDLTAGGMLLWCLGSAATAILLPGASYLFAWPSFFGVLMSVYLIMSKDGELITPLSVGLLCLCAAPSIVLFVPLTALTYTALGPANSDIVMILTALQLTMLIPQISSLGLWRRWWFPGMTALIGFTLLIYGSITTSFDKDRPKPTGLFYLSSSDSKTAIWAGADRVPDEWTSHYFTQNVKFGPVTEYFPSLNWFLQGAAQYLPLPSPNISLIDKQISGEGVAMRLLVTSGREAPHIFVYASVEEGEIMGAGIYEEVVRPGRGNQLVFNCYNIPKEGLTLTLLAKNAKSIKFTVLDQSYGIPQFQNEAYKPRPEYMIPMSFRFNDSTLVARSFTF